MAEKFAIRGLSKVFTSQNKAAVEALRDIDLTIADGEFVSIVGASGSGKSTLLRIIDGLETATSGTVEVDGRSVTRPGRDRAMVFQQDSLLPWRTVLDNVGYGLLLAGTPRAEAMTTAQRFVDLTGLRGFERHYPHQLSGGMRQRVNVARALAMDPEILLLDEPFASLDAERAEALMVLVERIRDELAIPILLVSHDRAEVERLAGRVVTLS